MYCTRGYEWILTICILFVINYTGRAQEYVTNNRSITTRDGLSNRAVLSIHQDHNNIMWIGTRNGLNRYDGYRFQVFNTKNSGLHHNVINDILVDPNDRIWLVHQDKHQVFHISFLNPNNSEIKAFDLFDIDLSLYRTIIQTKDKNIVFERKDGKLFWLEQEGLSELDSDVPFKILNHRENIILAVNSENTRMLYKISSNKEILLEKEMKNDCSKAFVSDEFFFILHPMGNHLKFLTYDHIFRLSDQYDFIGRQMEYSDKIFWIDDFLYHVKHNSFSIYNEKGLIFNSLEMGGTRMDRSINKIYVDNMGHKWFSSNNGILIFDFKETPFKRYLSFDHNEYLLDESYRCRGLWADEEKLFVHTRKGRYKIDLKSGESQLLPKMTSSNHHDNYFRFPVIRNSRGNYYIASNTLIETDDKGNEDNYIHYADDITPKKIWSLFEDKNEKVWMGTYQGLNSYERDDGFVREQHEYGAYPDLGDAFISGFFTDDKQQVWIFSDKGIFLFDTDKGIPIAQYGSGQDGSAYLPLGTAYHMHHDKQGRYWIATEGNGLILWDKTNENYRQFNTEDGLSNNTLYAIYEDDFGYLWLSSDNGIIRFDKDKETVTRIYVPEDGISHYEFNKTSHFKATDGTIYFGGLNGVTAFHPKDFQHDTIVYPLHINEFTIADPKGFHEQNIASVLPQGDEDPYLIKPGVSIKNITVTAPNYMYRDDIEFYYRFRGNPDGWKKTKDNLLFFSRPKRWTHHVLEIKVKDKFNRNLYSQLEIPLILEIPLYQQPSFMLFMGLFLIASVVVIFFWRGKRLKKKQMELERIVEQRTYTISKQSERLQQLDKNKSIFFANVSHELRTPLTLIHGPVQHIIQRKKVDGTDMGYLRIVEQNVNKLLGRINEILDLSRLESDRLELNETTVHLYSFISRLSSSFESNAQFKDILYSIRLVIPKHLQVRLDQDKFEKVFNNLLSNALKFTPRKGEVRVSLEETDDACLLLSVKDSGPGIPKEDLERVFDRFYQSSNHIKSSEGTGIGLNLSKQLAEIMGGNLSVDSQTRMGATFHFKFPMTRVLQSLKQPITETIQTPTIHTEAVPPPINNGIKILLVEDNYDLNQYIQQLLSDYHVITAMNGEEALTSLGQHKDIQLIISDMMMPLMDGLEFLGRVKQSEAFEAIPFIMLTARADIQDKLNALRIGVDDYIIKPFNNDELMVRVGNLLKNQQNRSVPHIEPIPTESTKSNSSEVDSKWLREAERTVKRNLGAKELNVEFIATQMDISSRQFQRKIKASTGLTANQYIKEIKLHKARKYLEEQTYRTVNEVSYAVGFEDPSYFSRLYAKRFGKKPIDYLK